MEKFQFNRFKISKSDNLCLSPKLSLKVSGMVKVEKYSIKIESGGCYVNLQIAQIMYRIQAKN